MATTEEDPLPGPVPRARLTKREHEVAGHIADGLKYHEIAASLGINYNTVNTHTKAIYRKLGVHRREHVAALVNALRQEQKP